MEQNSDPGSGMEQNSDPGSGLEEFGSGINILDPQHWFYIPNIGYSFRIFSISSLSEAGRSFAYYRGAG
jgi:hypothetical protein